MRGNVGLSIRLARAAHAWWSITHTDIEHDHHCSAMRYHHGKLVSSGEACTCGLDEFLTALLEYDLANKAAVGP